MKTSENPSNSYSRKRTSYVIHSRIQILIIKKIATFNHGQLRTITENIKGNDVYTISTVQFCIKPCFLLLLFFFFLCSFFRYLRKDHIKHCVPSNVSSGPATLPLSFVYVNNTADKSKPTNKSLPTGEVLNGKKSYQQIVSYFTTITMSPEEIYELGLKMLNELYP